MGEVPPAPRPSPRRRRRIVGPIVSTTLIATLFALGGWAYLHPQPIIDQITVWQFTPSASVISHTERLSLTERGAFLYYASSPKVSSKDAFSTECPARADEADFGILGCYQPSDKTIFLFDVTDARLDGTEDVTAAHEMLHAAWDRLGDDERQRLETLLEVEYDRLSADSAFAERMAFYARTEPGQRANELHSIIGTEVNELGPELEEYYATYFTDRTIVTALHATSNAVFVDLQNQADSILAQLESLRVGIEADYASYSSGYTAFNSSVGNFNQRADAGEFTSQAQFDRERNGLLSRKNDLDALFVTITSRSAQYDELSTQLDAINVTSAELSRGLNIGGEVSSDL
jgi:predicted metalloprotease